MRLSSKEKEIINTILNEIFKKPKVYLFGSRLDKTKKGGDIDLYVISQDSKDLLEKKIKAIAKLQNRLNKPVDIVIHKEFNRVIEQEALKGEILWVWKILT